MTDISIDRTIVTDFEPAVMVCTQDNHILAKCNNKITEFDENGKILRTITSSIVISNFALSACSEIIATGNKDNTIVKVSESGKVAVLCSTSPLTPDGICINKEGEIVVGMNSDQGLRSRKLTFFSIDRMHVKRKIEKNTKGESIFKGSGIMKVIQNGINHDYITIDGDKRMLCLEEKGDPKWEIPGDNIVDIDCDKEGNIVVCDNGKDRISLLDSCGALVRHVLTDGDKLGMMVSMVTDVNGRLWIGMLTNADIRIVRLIYDKNKTHLQNSQPSN